MSNATDAAVLTEISDGKITVDPETGHVFRRGKSVGKALASGYIAVYIPTIRRQAFAHRIVWLACHGEIRPGHVINHRNRRKWDNRLLNLEAITQSANVAHARGLARYDKVRPEDVAAVDPAWLADAVQRAAAGEELPSRPSGDPMPMMVRRSKVKYHI